MATTRGALRLPQFSDQVRAISERQPIAEKIIDGAVWEIQHDPMGVGVYIEKYDVWQARLILPSPPELLLMYSINARLVTMLTIIPADRSSPN